MFSPVTAAAAAALRNPLFSSIRFVFSAVIEEREKKMKYKRKQHLISPQKLQNTTAQQNVYEYKMIIFTFILLKNAHFEAEWRKKNNILKHVNDVCC